MAAQQMTSPLRVAVDATSLIGARTGVGVFTAGALTALARRGDLDLLGYGLTWGGRGRLAGVLPAGVRACRVPMAAAPLLKVWQRLDGPVGEWWTGPVDVVHGTNFVVPPTRRAAQVVTVHDLTAIRFPELCPPTALAYPALVARALRRGAMVHTHSSSVADEVVDAFGVDPARVRVVAPGVDRVEPASAAGDGPRYVLALGTVEPRKDLPTLVRAFGELAAGHPDLELVIAGPAGWGEEAVAAEVDASPYRHRIRRMGWLSDGDRAALLDRAAVFAYPSVYEGFGFPPLEAMAHGTPVVATSAGSVPEVVGDAAVLVAVGDADGLAAALAGVLDDRAERDRLVRAGTRRVGEFTWERCAEGLVRLYRDAAAARR